MTDRAPRPASKGTTLYRLGGSVARHPWRVVVAWVAIAFACLAVAVGGVAGQSLFQRLHAAEPSVHGDATTGREIIAQYRPSSSTMMFQTKGADLTDPKRTQFAALALAGIMDLEGVKSVVSPVLSPKGLTDPAVTPLLKGGSAASGSFLTIVTFDPGLDRDRLRDLESRVDERFRQMVNQLPGATGDSGSVTQVVDDITSTVAQDLVRGEGIAVPVTFLVMVLVFGGLLAAGMPVAGALVSIAGALMSLFGFSFAVDLDAYVVNIVTVLGLGLSIDYGLLIVSRYREELARLRDGDVTEPVTRQHAVTAGATTLATAGRTVLFSGLTVAISLSGLLMFEPRLMRAIGLAGVSVVLVAMVVSISLVVALCSLGAGRIGRKRHEDSSDSGLFSRLAIAVQRRSWAVIVVVGAVLLAIASPLLDLRMTSSSTELLPPHANQRVFFDTLATDYPTTRAPVATVVVHATPTDPRVVDLARAAKALPGVTGVTTSALGPEYATVDVRSAARPTSDTALDIVHALRDTDVGVQTWTTGQAAAQIDFLASLSASLGKVIALIAGATFVLLFLLTGSVVLPIKALVLNTLSLAAALGFVVWVFQWDNLAGLLSFSSVGAIESMVPFLVLAFGFGLSMDYEVFLLARITEFHDRGATSDDAVRLGLQHTGRIITSAALLVVIVFTGFLVGDILMIKEVGLAIVAAVAIDATLVRMLLVPATMTVLGDWNWWAPAPLRRLHARFRISD